MSREKIKKHSRWDEAIEDAETQLREAKKRVFRLKDAIAGFKARRENGDPWPGSKITSEESSATQD